MLGLLAAVVLQKSVAVPARAMRLDALLKAVGAQAGETYAAGRGMDGRIVFVGGPARPLEALRRDLALATWGKWRHGVLGWTLDEDRDAAALRERTRLASRIAQVKAQQAAMRGTAAKPFDAAAAKELLATMRRYDEAEAKKDSGSYKLRERVEDALPANAAVRRVVAGLDPAEIASLETGRVVYSDRPTRLQRPLGSVGTNAARAVERDQNVWAARYADKTDFEASHRSRMLIDPRGFPDPVAPGSLRLILKVEATDNGQTMFGGYFVDRDLRLRQFGTVNVFFRDGGGRDDAAPKVDPKEPKLALSPEARALSASRQGKAVAPILRPIFLNPERRDPLDVLMAEGLRGVAKARGASIVAWLGDDGMNFTAGAGESAGEWLRDLYHMNYEVHESAGSVLIRPRFAAVNADRPALGRLARAADAVGYLPLDDFAEYAAQTPSAYRFGDTLTSITFDVLLPGAMQASRTDWDVLALWGGFSRAQRQTLVKGAALPWAAVAKDQRDRLVAAILHADDHDLQRQQGGGHPYITLEDEPTEALAGGLGFGEGVQGMGNVEEGVFAASPDENPWNAGMTSAWGLARALADRERDPKGEHFDGLPKELPDAYLPGRIVNFGIQIALSPGLTWRKQAMYGEFDLRAKPVALDAMPETFRKTYERATAQQRRQRGG